MGCKQCAKNRQRSLEKRRQLRDQKISRLEASCDQGDRRSCMTLQHLLGLEDYRRTNQYRSELHRRAT